MPVEPPGALMPVLAPPWVDELEAPLLDWPDDLCWPALGDALCAVIVDEPLEPALLPPVGPAALGWLPPPDEPPTD